MSVGNLTGRYWIKILRSAFKDGHRLCPRTRDRAELRRQALKLRFWPQPKPEENGGQVMDLDWSYIKSMPGEKVGELRIHDTIGGNDNIRIIFFVGPDQPGEDMPKIWVLAAMQKKSNDFSAHNIATFRARRQIAMERFYETS